MRLLCGNRVVLDADLIGAWDWSDGINAGDGSVYWRLGEGNDVRSLRAARDHPIGSQHSNSKPKDQNHGSQRRRESHLPQPVRRIKRQPAQNAALLRRLQPFLQPHARRRQQIRRRILGAILREQRVKILLSLQFDRAVGAAGYVLLQFVAGVIGQLAINVKHHILSNPFTLHKLHL